MMNNEDYSYKDDFYIYDADEDNGFNIITKVKTKIQIDSSLSVNDKLNKLVNELENEMGDVSIDILSIENNIATIRAKEIKPIWGTIGPKVRFKCIESTLKQKTYNGSWLTDVILNYNTGINGDV
ncbi:MAG: hypothetical protein ACRC92_08685 [Peptostreptococcaceae bacterium]